LLAWKLVLVFVEILLNQWKHFGEWMRTVGGALYGIVVSKFHLVSVAIVHTGRRFRSYIGYQNTIGCILMHLLKFRLDMCYVHRESLRVQQ